MNINSNNFSDIGFINIFQSFFEKTDYELNLYPIWSKMINKVPDDHFITLFQYNSHDQSPLYSANFSSSQFYILFHKNQSTFVNVCPSLLKENESALSPAVVSDNPHHNEYLTSLSLFNKVCRKDFDSTDKIKLKGKPIAKAEPHLFSFTYSADFFKKCFNLISLFLDKPNLTIHDIVPQIIEEGVLPTEFSNELIKNPNNSLHISIVSSFFKLFYNKEYSNGYSSACIKPAIYDNVISSVILDGLPHNKFSSLSEKINQSASFMNTIYKEVYDENPHLFLFDSNVIFSQAPHLFHSDFNRYALLTKHIENFSENNSTHILPKVILRLSHLSLFLDNHNREDLMKSNKIKDLLITIQEHFDFLIDKYPHYFNDYFKDYCSAHCIELVANLNKIILDKTFIKLKTLNDQVINETLDSIHLLLPFAYPLEFEQSDLIYNSSTVVSLNVLNIFLSSKTSLQYSEFFKDIEYFVKNNLSTIDISEVKTINALKNKQISSEYIENGFSTISFNVHSHFSEQSIEALKSLILKYINHIYYKSYSLNNDAFIQTSKLFNQEFNLHLKMILSETESSSKINTKKHKI